MWFINAIVNWLSRVSDYLYDAYQEVRGWVWPFYYLANPLYYLSRAFSYITEYFGEFNEWAGNVADWLAGVLDLSQITAYFRTWIDAAIDAWDWVSRAFSNVWNIVDDWWSSTQFTVRAWIAEAKSYADSLLGEVNRMIANLQAAWDSLRGWIPTLEEISLWWGNWTGNVLTAINTWWNSTLLEVRALIDSAFLERESWWAGWEEMRDRVATFFSDPLEFLWDRFADWFLGPEE